MCRIRVWPELDSMTRAIIGRSGDKSAAQLREGIHSYIASLDAEAPNVLASGWGF